jgi:hypothetical protein
MAHITDPGNTGYKQVQNRPALSLNKYGNMSAEMISVDKLEGYGKNWWTADDQ